MDIAQSIGRPYRPCVIDAALQNALAASSAVVMEGARASGKTMTALHAAASYVFIDEADAQCCSRTSETGLWFLHASIEMAEAPCRLLPASGGLFVPQARVAARDQMRWQLRRSRAERAGWHGS